MVKIAYWAQGGESIDFLIPKKSGFGFLRSPLGHHMNENDRDWYSQVECDVWGLDGTLSFQTGYLFGKDSTKEAIKFAEIIKPRYEFDSVEEVSWNSMFLYLNGQIKELNALKPIER